jgi:hypothetical protein
MPWCRIDDAAMSHPKIVGLSDKAFRLWVWGLAYAQLHLTDGRIIAEAIPARLKRASADLLGARLWETEPSGFQIHDYLDWNESREVVLAKRDGARHRLQMHREKRVASPDVKRVSSLTSETLLARSGVECSGSVPEKGSGEKPSDRGVETRAGWLLERYAELYEEHRGAHLLLIPSPKQFMQASELVKRWPDARLEKLAILVLTTDMDSFIVNSDRGFAVFFQKASWADNRLAEWERGRAS